MELSPLPVKHLHSKPASHPLNLSYTVNKIHDHDFNLNRRYIVYYIAKLIFSYFYRIEEISFHMCADDTSDSSSVSDKCVTAAYNYIKCNVCINVSAMQSVMMTMKKQ